MAGSIIQSLAYAEGRLLQLTNDLEQERQTMAEALVMVRLAEARREEVSDLVGRLRRAAKEEGVE